LCLFKDLCLLFNPHNRWGNRSTKKWRPLRPCTPALFFSTTLSCVPYKTESEARVKCQCFLWEQQSQKSQGEEKFLTAETQQVTWPRSLGHTGESGGTETWSSHSGSRGHDHDRYFTSYYGPWKEPFSAAFSLLVALKFLDFSLFQMLNIFSRLLWSFGEGGVLTNRGRHSASTRSPRSYWLKKRSSFMLMMCPYSIIWK
jgi:hypothetical protein